MLDNRLLDDTILSANRPAAECPRETREQATAAPRTALAHNRVRLQRTALFRLLFNR